jgi:Ankyrin repeats (3 copies)
MLPGCTLHTCIISRFAPLGKTRDDTSTPGGSVHTCQSLHHVYFRLNHRQSIWQNGQYHAEASEANKVRAKILDAVKRQSEQIVVAFLHAAASNDTAAVDRILDEGSIEVDDSDGPLPAVARLLVCTVWWFSFLCWVYKLHAGASRTALHLAASKGHLEMVTRLVVKYAASPTIRDKYGSTPLDDAIRHKHMPVVQFLATQPIATDLGSASYIEKYVSALLWRFCVRKTV